MHHNTIRDMQITSLIVNKSFIQKYKTMKFDVLFALCLYCICQRLVFSELWKIGITVIWEIFVGKIFSWGKSTTKIKRTKIFIR